MMAPDGIDQARAVLAATRDHLRAEAERCAADAERIERALACLDEVWATEGGDAVEREDAPRPADALGPGKHDALAEDGHRARVEREPRVHGPHPQAAPLAAGRLADAPAAEAASVAPPPPDPGPRIEAGSGAGAGGGADDEKRVPLSERERAVMTQLWRARDEKNQVALSQREIAERGAIPLGSMTFLFSELVDLRCIRQVRPADNKTPTVWRLLCDPDGRPARVRTFAVESA